MLLFFMVKIRGTLSFPYIALGITIFIFKTFNLNLIRIKTLNFSNLILYSAIISFILLVSIDKSVIINNITTLNIILITDSIYQDHMVSNLLIIFIILYNFKIQ